MSDTRSPVVGHYVHHQGSGHLHRALAITDALARGGARSTLLSSVARPAAYAGDWVHLARDDEPRADPGGSDPTAGGHLHWVPSGHPGLLRRMAALSAWIERAEPDVLISDVSQEVTLLARLHGVPVVSVVLPGDRTDAAHLLGLGVSAELVGFWPQQAAGTGPGMTPRLPAALADRIRPLGGLSRFAPVEPSPPREQHERRVVVLAGTGGSAVSEADLDRSRAATPGWTWQVLGPGSWVEDPWPVLRSASVVVTHAGQNALAEVAAARVPAVVVPAPRPHDEQATTAAVLGAGDWPVVVRDQWPTRDWAHLLEQVAGLHGGAWATWVDGGAAGRLADLAGERWGARVAS